MRIISRHLHAPNQNVKRAKRGSPPPFILMPTRKKIRGYGLFHMERRPVVAGARGNVNPLMEEAVDAHLELTKIIDRSFLVAVILPIISASLTGVLKAIKHNVYQDKPNLGLDLSIELGPAVLTLLGLILTLNMLRALNQNSAVVETHDTELAPFREKRPAAQTAILFPPVNPGISVPIPPEENHCTIM